MKLIGMACAAALCVAVRAADGTSVAPAPTPEESGKVRAWHSVKGIFPEDVKTVGIVMPSSVMERKKLEKGVQMLESAGYRVKVGDFVRVEKRASAEDRAKDFEKMWLDPEVDVIFMARGGEGAAEVIDKVDWERLRSRNMRVIGFSDITLILNTMLSQKAGHPYSGPMLSSFSRWDRDSIKWFRAMLDGAALKPVKVRVLKAGAAKGLPMGGHLERLHRLVTATKFAPSAAGRVVFVECTARYPVANVKSYLEELRDSGYLKDAAAVVFADFRHEGDDRKVLDEFLPAYAQTLKCPVFADYPYGHCTKSYLIDFFREVSISADGVVKWQKPANMPQAAGRDPLKVCVYADEGASGIGAIEWFRLVDDSPEMELRLVDGDAVRAGGLDGADVLVMPGGDSKLQFTSLGPDGVKRMKEFVAAGGGYIGTCGGCYLLLDRTGGSHKRAHMVPWDKSGSEHSLLYPTFNLNEKGAAALGLKAGKFKMRYHGGPFLYPCTNAIAEANVESWGTFEAEACMTGRVDPEKRMYGATAILGGMYGKGRVLGIAGHPEYFDSTLYLVKGAFRYVAGREVTFPARLHTPRAIAVGFLAKGIGGVETAETALALAAESDFDLVPIDKDGIFQRRLDNIDVLVVSNDSAKKDETLASAINEFASRGGKVVGFGTGRAVLPKGGIECEPRDGAVRAIKRLFDAEAGE